MKFVMNAAMFSAKKHSKQRRKDADASPYINHPLALAYVLTNEGMVEDPVVIAGALLHDTIEDTDTTAEELRSEFGQEVLDVVLEVTDDKSLPKAMRKQHQIDHAPHISFKAKLVKLADKICNLRDMNSAPPTDWSAARIAGYYDWANQVVDGLRGTHAGLEALFDQAYAQKPAVEAPVAPAP